MIGAVTVSVENSANMDIAKAIGEEKDIRLAASNILESCRNAGAVKDDMTVLLTAFKKEK